MKYTVPQIAAAERQFIDGFDRTFPDEELDKYYNSRELWTIPTDWLVSFRYRKVQRTYQAIGLNGIYRTWEWMVSDVDKIKAAVSEDLYPIDPTKGLSYNELKRLLSFYNSEGKSAFLVPVDFLERPSKEN